MSITKEDKEKIKKEYLDGSTVRDLSSKYKKSTATIGPICKGLRSVSEAEKLSYRLGRHHLTDAGRLSLSEKGKKSFLKSGKYWTKPERQFRELLLEIDIGIKYPDYIKEVKNVSDDENEKLFCYQYPIERFVLDFVDIENKVAININGDYWHGNPLLYKEDVLSKIQKTNISRDKYKRIFLERLGWKVIDIWESEIYWNKVLVKNKIKERLPDNVRESCDPIIDWSETLKRLWFKDPHRNKRKVIDVICPTCNKAFKTKEAGKRTHKYCCHKCSIIAIALGRQKDMPSREVLMDLMLSMSMVKVGEKYNVSSTTVKKWVKHYNISDDYLLKWAKYKK